MLALTTPKQQFADSAGNPLSGGKLFVYIAGTTTLVGTSADPDGNTPNGNPIILNSFGVVPQGVYVDSGTYKLKLTDKDGAEIWTIDGVSPINDVSIQASEWTAFSGTPTFLTSTTFSVDGAQESVFSINRRLKLIVTAGTLYGTVTDAVFDAGTSKTTVTVNLDSGALDNGLSSASVSLLGSTNLSVPGFANIGGTFKVAPALQVGGLLSALAGLNVSGAPVNESHGTDIASAATIDLDSATGNLVDVTGTTAITAITLSEGRERTVRFTGSLTLTHGDSLVIPYGQDITTQAGDFAIFRGYASNVVRLVSYQAAISPAFGHGMKVFTASGTFTPTVTGPHIVVLRGGGGGGGGGARDSTNPGGGGGGQGDLAFGLFQGTAGTGVTVTVGAGGSGGAGGSSVGAQAGGAGGTTTVSSVSAGGGLGGAIKGTGGGDQHTNSTTSFVGGDGAGTGHGTGGQSENAAGSSATANTGGGGGGGANSSGGTGGNGGAGGSGLCIVIW